MRWNRMFVGWSAEGLPVVTSSEDDLLPDPRENYSIFKNSGLSSRRIDTPELVAAEYVYTGPVHNFIDDEFEKAEDLIAITIKDESGTEQTIKVGELAILKAIAESDKPWQETDNSSLLDMAKDTKLWYTLLLPHPSKKDTTIALIFKPITKDQSNAIKYQNFIRDVISRLLVVDEGQTRRFQKGYVKAAVKYAGQNVEGFFDLLFENGDQLVREFIARAISLLVDLGPDSLEKLKNPPGGYYNLEEIGIDKLVQLAATMHKSAEDYF